MNAFTLQPRRPLKKPRYKYNEDIFPEREFAGAGVFQAEERETLPHASNPFYESAQKEHSWSNYRSTQKARARGSKSLSGAQLSNLFQPKHMRPAPLGNVVSHETFGALRRKGAPRAPEAGSDFVVNHIFNINNVNINQVYQPAKVSGVLRPSLKGRNQLFRGPRGLTGSAGARLRRARPRRQAGQGQAQGTEPVADTAEEG